MDEYFVGARRPAEGVGEVLGHEKRVWFVALSDGDDVIMFVVGDVEADWDGKEVLAMCAD